MDPEDGKEVRVTKSRKIQNLIMNYSPQRVEMLYRAINIQKGRREEHTSEFQSHHDPVCRLLLEKKNK